jgi:PAS domain S-box-containing protein
MIVVDYDLKVFLANLQYFGITAVPAAWLAFALEYTGREKWLTRRNLTLLMLEPVLTVFFTFTNEYHHLFHSSVTLGPVGDSFIAFSVRFGPAFWVHAVYSYILLLAGTYLLMQSLVRSPRFYRGQVVTMLFAAFTPWIANAISIFGDNPFYGVDLTPIAFAVTVLALGWNIHHYRLMDIVPVARETVMESMSDAVMVLDVQNRIVDVNPAALRIINLNSSTGVIGELAGNVLSGLSPHLVEQYRSVAEAQAEIVIAHEEERHFALRISPLKNRYGDLTGRLFVLHEITALKNAAEQIRLQNETLVQTNHELAVARVQAEEASRLKSEFLAIMSHELRTPLNSVIGYAELMLTGLVGNLPPRQEDYVQRILSNGEQLLAMINEILDLSKIEAGRLKLNNQLFIPADLLKDIEIRMQSLSVQKGLSLESHLDPALPVCIVGDLVRLEQIMINLLGNAIRFTEKGYVRISFDKSSDSEWVISVTDTGCGIPEHALEFIFDEFRQVDGSSQRQYGGTGLGLAIVRKLARLMNGDVSVQSELNKGSHFSVRLPLIIAEESAAE